MTLGFRKILILSLFLIGSGFTAGYFVFSGSSTLSSDGLDLKSRIGEAHLEVSSRSLTNPLLECDLGPTYISQNTTAPFKDRIYGEIKKITSEGRVAMAAYYFRDLNNGAWFGFKERESFVPASLAKVPLLISALAKVEDDQNFINQEVRYVEGDAGAPQFIPPKNPIQIGKMYSVKELIEHTIQESDNNAALLLSQLVGSARILQTFTDLGLAAPTAGQDTTISVRDYASFFRVLYNASYLSRPYSEAALTLLTETEFDDGLRAGVPSDIKVAHKFGERLWQGQQQFHDCGIVYYPKKPYLLCIMTRGDGYTSLIDTIKQLSTITYEEVKKQD